jgi:threonine/homoserine efflux transporter RhtA
MTTDSRRTIARAMAWLALAVGMMLLLNEAHSSGEALETFKLVFSSNAGTLFGATIVFIAAAALVALHLGDIKRILKHR